MSDMVERLKVQREYWREGTTQWDPAWDEDVGELLDETIAYIEELEKARDLYDLPE